MGRASKRRALLAFFLISCFTACLAAAASAFTVTLDSPADNASVFEGAARFVFTASGKPPIQCELLFDNATAANATAQKNLPAAVSANLSKETMFWSVRCTDAEGAQAESALRALVVQGAEGTDEVEAEEAEAKPPNAGTLSGFVVTRGAEREENALFASWRANPGRRVALAALFSNDGSNALNVSLKVTISQSNGGSDGAGDGASGSAGGSTGENAVVASLESERVLVAPGEKRVLQVEWTPSAEGAFVAEAVVAADGDGGAAGGSGAAGAAGAEFGKAFLQLSVARPPNADWFFLVALVCVAALALALFKTRLNANAIKGGGLD